MCVWFLFLPALFRIESGACRTIAAITRSRSQRVLHLGTISSAQRSSHFMSRRASAVLSAHFPRRFGPRDQANGCQILYVLLPNQRWRLWHRCAADRQDPRRLLWCVSPLTALIFPTRADPATAQDPGILINIYQSLTTYAIPGPTPYGTAVPAIAATPWPTTATWNTASQPTTVPSVPAGSSTASAPTGTGSASGATQTPYGQCGGQGYTGPTACTTGNTCKAQSTYYSQVRPFRERRARRLAADVILDSACRRECRSKGWGLWVVGTGSNVRVHNRMESVSMVCGLLELTLKCRRRPKLSD
jgi:hypothetical protein